MGQWYQITDLTSDPALQARLRELGNGDAVLGADELPLEVHGQLECTPALRKWPLEQFRALEAILLGKNLVGRRRIAACGPAIHDRMVVTEIPGSAHAGSVKFFRQVHANPLGGSTSCAAATARYQERILQELLQTHPADIFVEGLPTDAPPGEAGQFFEQMELALLVQARDFAHASVGSINPKILIPDLQSYGAALVYAVLEPSVYLHRTVAAQGSARIDGLLEKLRLAHKHHVKQFPVRHYDVQTIFQYREEQAVDEMATFLSRHAGASIVLIFGAAHQFDRYFAALPFPPQLQSIYFEATALAIDAQCHDEPDFLLLQD